MARSVWAAVLGPSALKRRITARYRSLSGATNGASATGQQPPRRTFEDAEFRHRGPDCPAVMPMVPSRRASAVAKLVASYGVGECGGGGDRRAWGRAGGVVSPPQWRRRRAGDAGAVGRGRDRQE